MHFTLTLCGLCVVGDITNFLSTCNLTNGCLLCGCVCRSGIFVRGVDWIQDNLHLFLMLALSFISVTIVGLLFLYHSYLMLTGQTTWEQASRHKIHYLKDLPNLSNPFNEGCICNTLRFTLYARLRDWDTLYQTRIGSPNSQGHHNS